MNHYYVYCHANGLQFVSTGDPIVIAHSLRNSEEKMPKCIGRWRFKTVKNKLYPKMATDELNPYPGNLKHHKVEAKPIDIKNMTVKKRKSKGRTGFRNGDLFCFNCGRSYTIPYPQPLTMATAMMTQFAKDHEKCPPVWIEPVNKPEGKTEAENANWWAHNGEHGISSKTMYNRLCKGVQVARLKNDYEGHPHDPDDFRRCYLLLQAVPQWKDKLDMMKTVSPMWAKLVENWDQLTCMLEAVMKTNSGEAKEMYELMQSIGC